MAILKQAFGRILAYSKSYLANMIRVRPLLGLGAVSWTAETVTSRANGRVCRGYHSPTYFYINTVNHRHEDIGWRPILEEEL